MNDEISNIDGELKYWKEFDCPWCYWRIPLEYMKITSWNYDNTWNWIRMMGTCPKCKQECVLQISGGGMNVDVYHKDGELLS